VQRTQIVANLCKLALDGSVDRSTIAGVQRWLNGSCIGARCIAAQTVQANFPDMLLGAGNRVTLRVKQTLDELQGLDFIVAIETML
jgi:hypothetical protein